MAQPAEIARKLFKPYFEYDPKKGSVAQQLVDRMKTWSEMSAAHQRHVLGHLLYLNLLQLGKLTDVATDQLELLDASNEALQNAMGEPGDEDDAPGALPAHLADETEGDGTPEEPEPEGDGDDDGDGDREGDGAD